MAVAVHHDASRGNHQPVRWLHLHLYCMSRLAWRGAEGGEWRRERDSPGFAYIPFIILSVSKFSQLIPVTSTNFGFGSTNPVTVLQQSAGSLAFSVCDQKIEEGI